MSANFGAIYVFNRLFGVIGVNEGLLGIFGGLSEVYWGHSGTIRVIVAVKVKLGAFSTILWPLVLFGGYLEAVSTRSFRSFQRPYEDILAQMCHSGDIWGLSGPFVSIGANFGAIYIFNRLFGAVGVNGGSQEYLGAN